MELQVKSQASGSVDVVALFGTLDSATARSLTLSLDKQIAAGRTRLLLDLSGIDFIDSSGLSVLIGAMKATRRTGGNIGLLNPTATVKSVLELTRLHRVLEIFADEREAVAKLAR